MRPLHKDDPRRMGDHRLVAVLGEGTTARVFLGATPEGRPIVIKAVRPVPARNTAFRARFAREVAAARRVENPFVVPVIDASPSGSAPWIGTAYAPGPGLAEAVERHGPLPAQAVRTLAAGIASGLGALHAEDLTPGRLDPVLVSLAPDGPRLVDLGVARSPDGPSVTDGDVLLGTVLPSPSFRAPEQLDGRGTGPEADVFSLGAVLVHAARGVGPFGDDTDPGVADRIVHGTPDLNELPSWLRELVAACLAKEPAERPTPAQVLAATASELDGPGWLPAPLAAEVAQRAATVWTRSGGITFGGDPSPDGVDGAFAGSSAARARPGGSAYPGAEGAARGADGARGTGRRRRGTANTSGPLPESHPTVPHADNPGAIGPRSSDAGSTLPGPTGPARGEALVATPPAAASANDGGRGPEGPDGTTAPQPPGSHPGSPVTPRTPPAPASRPGGPSGDTTAAGTGTRRRAADAPAPPPQDPPRPGEGDAPVGRAGRRRRDAQASKPRTVPSPRHPSDMPTGHEHAHQVAAAAAAPAAPAAPAARDASRPAGEPPAHETAAPRTPASAESAPTDGSASPEPASEAVPEADAGAGEIVPSEVIEAELVDDDEPLPPRASAAAAPGVTDLPGRPAKPARDASASPPPPPGPGRTNGAPPHSAADAPPRQSAPPRSPADVLRDRAERRRFIKWVAAGAAVLAGTATGAVLWGDGGGSGKSSGTDPAAPLPPASSSSPATRAWLRQGTLSAEQLALLSEELRTGPKLADYTVELHPEAAVTSSLIGGSGRGTPVTDVFEVDVLSLASHVAAGRIADLTPYQERFDTNTWLPALRSSVTVDSKVVALPLTASAPVVMFHQGMYAEAGVPVPRTREEWVDGLEHLRTRFGANPAFRSVYLPGRAWPVLASFMWEGGGAVAVREGDAWRGAFDLPGSTDGVRFFRQLQQYAPEARDIDETELKVGELFATGRTASVIGSAALYSAAIEADAGLARQLNAFPLPGHTADRPGAIGVGGTALVVSSACRDVPAALELLAVLASTPWRTRIAQAGGVLSPRAMPSQSVQGPNPMLRAGAGAAMAAGRAYPVAPGWSERPLVDFGRAVLGGTDAAAAAVSANQTVATQFGRTTG